MKIAIVISRSSLGGVGTSTYILANEMRKVGYQADILVTDWSPGRDYDRALRDGWPVEAISLGERWLRRRLAIVLERLSNYDVVINNHSTETKLVFPALPAHIVRLSVIRSTNEAVISEGVSYSSYVDALVGISPEVQRLLWETNVQCQTYIIPNSVLVSSDKFPKIQSSLDLAYLGRLTDIDKNILLLPEIANACRNQGLRFTLDVAGDGKDRERLKTKIQESKLRDCIKLVGAISRDLVGNFLSKRQFGIFPSNYEGFGLSLVEAMAVGCVPIASDIPSYRWILGDDAKTLLVPTNDAQAYAKRIVMLRDRPELYLEIQKRLHKRQREKFTPEATVNGYIHLIEELRKTHDPSCFSPVSLKNLPLSNYHRRRCSKIWWFMQRVRDRLKKPTSSL